MNVFPQIGMHQITKSMSLKKGKKIVKLENLDLFPSNNSNCPHSSTIHFIVSSHKIQYITKT